MWSLLSPEDAPGDRAWLGGPRVRESGLVVSSVGGGWVKLPQAGGREAGGWAQFVLGVKGEFFSEEFWERRQLEQAANHPSLSLTALGGGVSLPTRLNPLQPVVLPGT